MKAIARIFIAVIVIHQYRLDVANENNKLLSSWRKNRKGSTLKMNLNNNFIYQFTQDRKKTLLNKRDFLTFPKQGDKDFSRLHGSIEKQKLANTTKFQKEISHGRLTTHRSLQSTHESLQATHKIPRNTQRMLEENEPFSNELTKQKSHKYSARNLFKGQVLDGAETKEISRETLKKFSTSKKNKLNVKCMADDMLESKTVQMSKFESSPTLSESKLENNLSSKTSRRPPQIAFVFKLSKMKENYASSNEEVVLQSKKIFPLPATLNALHEVLLVHSFEIWKLKHEFSSMKDIRVHENTLHEVIQNPWNERLKHKLYKVLQGEDVYLDVFGGSNTVGTGLMKDECDLERRYSKVITHWWDKIITPTTGSRLKLREIAIGGTSSEFFQFCFGSYIHENLDLVFIEMAVNDMRELPSNANKSVPLEQLTRQLLAYPTEPALVYINLFKGLFCSEGCTNVEDYGQDLLTDTYNITTLKWRNAVCSKIAGNNLKDPCDLISSDGLHINELGHAHISLMVINLCRRILLDHISIAITNLRVFNKTKSTRLPRGIAYFTRDQLPPAIVHEEIALPHPVLINKVTKIISDPLCSTGLSPNYNRVNAIKNTLDVIITKTKGFYLQNTKIGGKCSKPPCRVDAYSSWTGKTVGANITFSFTVPGGNSSQGIKSWSAGGIQTRSIVVGIRTCWNCGTAVMLLDSDYKNKHIVNTKLDYERTSATIVALHVEPGAHTLNVEIIKEGKVSILAIMVGPSDGPY